MLYIARFYIYLYIILYMRIKLIKIIFLFLLYYSRYGELSTSKVHVSVVEASKVSLIANTSSLPSSSVSSQILTLNTSSSVCMIVDIMDIIYMDIIYK